MPGHEPTPHYVTTAHGQLRLWRIGQGPDLVVLAGLVLAASETARRLTAILPDWRITVLELPGIGGSAASRGGSLDEVTDAVASAIAVCDFGPYVLAACDLAVAVAARLPKRLAALPDTIMAIVPAQALAWAERRLAPPPLTPRQDGTHLTALWSFIRDCHLLEPADATQPAQHGDLLPDPTTLDATIVAAAVAPERYTALWCLCMAAFPQPLPEGFQAVELYADLPNNLEAADRSAGAATVPATTAGPDGKIWYQYVDTPRGRMHLRRAGHEGRPLLVIPTGGGSSAQFAPVVQALVRERQVFAVDYLGNGFSDKPDREVTIEVLAEDMAALIKTLAFAQVDVWGSHTGALVGLELACRYPEIVGRVVLEGPVFISADFQHDLLSHYFPVIVPDKWGLHLPLVWNWRRDMFMYWPWYRVAREATRKLGVPSSEQLHAYAIGILESGTRYDQAYRSAFTYDTRARLPHLTRPALICAGPNDMLIDGLAQAKCMNQPGVDILVTPTTVWWPDPEPDAAARTFAIYDAYLHHGELPQEVRNPAAC